MDFAPVWGYAGEMFKRLMVWLNGEPSPSPHPEHVVRYGDYRFSRPISIWQAMKEERLAKEAGVPSGTTIEI
jgi:hypothetical protein